MVMKNQPIPEEYIVYVKGRSISKSPNLDGISQPSSTKTVITGIRVNTFIYAS